MAFVTTQDGVNIYFKDWGPKEAQPIVFHHGWPLSADDWDNQMLFFLAEGFRVIAIDRRGHGRSDQVSEGHDMDHYAADVSAVVEHLDLHNAVHVGHSTGGGEVVRYLARHGESRVAKAAIISAVPPLMVQTAANPGGLPKDAPKVRAARALLFGAWEGNWMAYNTAHDVKLPGSQGDALGFVMYPMAENADGWFDQYEPTTFKYKISASEVKA
mgnify:CR=1 FL=1